MKSKKNILSITITTVLCVAFVVYGLVLAYSTNVKRNTLKQANTVTTQGNTLSNSISTTNKKSGLVLQNTSFSGMQPIVNTPKPSSKNKFEFNVVREGTYSFDYNGKTIINTGVNSENEQYLEGSEAYIYTQLKIDSFDPNTVGTGKGDLDPILGDFEVTFYVDGYKVTSCETEAGRGCWYYFTKWKAESNSNNYTHHTAKCTLDSDGTFYVAVRKVLHSVGQHNIEVKCGDALLDKFKITVSDIYGLNFADKRLKEYKFGNGDSSLCSPYYACKRWNDGQYTEENLMRLATKMNMNNIVGDDKVFDNGLSPGSIITFDPKTDFPQQQDFITKSQGSYRSLNTSYDLKVLLIYPDNNGERELVELGNNKEVQTLNIGNKKYEYYTFNSTSHQIPLDWNEEEYKVKVIFFNEWCPKGQFYYTMTYTYKIDLITIDTEETNKQSDYFYVENSNVYSNVVLNMKNPASIDFNQISVTFNCNGTEKPATGYVEYNGHYYYYTDWSTPDIYNGMATVPVTARVNYRGKTIANGSVNLTLTVHDIDGIDEFKGYKVDENPLGYEDYTKTLYQQVNNSKIDGNTIEFHGGKYSLGETKYDGIYEVYKDETMYLANKTTSSGKPIKLYNAIYNTNWYPSVISNNSVNMLAMYPEYNYDTSYGTLLSITQNSNQYKDAKVVDRCKNPSLVDTNAHAVPVWWSEGSYTINTLLFNVWLPVGPVYAYDSWSYDIQGSVYGDWYITRNKG